MNKGNKEKNLVGITSIVQLIVLLISFIKPESIVSNEYTNELKESAGLGIFVMVIIFAILLWDEIKYTKNRLIGGNLFLIFVVPNTLVRIISIINILILAFVKYERREKINMKEACRILGVKSPEKNRNKWIMLILLLGIYFGQNFIQSEWLEGMSGLGLITFIAGIHLVLFILAILAFKEEIKDGTKIIANNFKLTIRYILNLFVKMILAMWIATIISVLITNKMTSVNQESIESLPLYITIPLAVLWAPFVEEAVFRGTFKKIVEHKLWFIIISGVAFGFLHAIGEATFAIALATSLPYIVIGMLFAYSYARTNNLAINILFHMLYNSLAVLASMLK